ncbi:unnamed protein product, partial [Chrysoparadoxa australica]
MPLTLHADLPCPASNSYQDAEYNTDNAKECRVKGVLKLEVMDGGERFPIS